MFSVIARLARGRMPLQWFGVVLVGAVLVLAGMAIFGGYDLRIRSLPFDVELSNSGNRAAEPRR
jgi:hypothetical protein